MFVVQTFDFINRFKINATTGVVTVASEGLNREQDPSFSLTVAATDSGGFSSRTQLTVFLSDVNDMSPQFEKSLFIASIRENEVEFIPSLFVKVVGQTF